MASNTTTAVPAYFEESWAILSSIGLVNVLFGLMIAGITSFSPLTIVPLVTSAAGGIANGLCYYAFYAHYAVRGTVVAAAVADVAWLVQEAGLSFYSYLILNRVLESRPRLIFLGLFWTVMLLICLIRVLILSSRARDILHGGATRQQYIDHLHVGYFGSIALIECISAIFLLRKFALARKRLVEASSKSGLFSYLMRSTEIRLTVLAFIGTTRAVTYSFQNTTQSATTTASQVDRFVYTLECLFPVVMFIDILASRLVVSNHTHDRTPSRTRAPRASNRTQPKDVTASFGDGEQYSMNHILETRVTGKGQTSSSQEMIFKHSSSRAGSRDDGEGSDIDRKASGITKTVEFQFHETVV